MDDLNTRPRPRPRHSLLVRLTHWINALVLLVLLASGLQIFNAHPALYWGQASTFAKPWVAMTAEPRGDGLAGYTQVGALKVETTGLLGLSNGERRGFPAWATLPSYRSLAEGRRWHFFFAWLFVINGLAYLAWGLVSRHFSRNLFPHSAELRPRSLWAEIKDHARLRFHHGRYNALQKLAYLTVVFVLLPLMVLSGLGMSPGVNAAWPWTFELFGGRQSARTIHFLSALSLVAFVLIHVAMVLVSGPLRQLRAMITGGEAPHVRGETR
ncbi:cytochrome b/b6 domain-containing protein [Phenylobacterium sp.]|uniref:cytochrome b/b6 domain-containing protein n=1 Tax=Phenylobacterium sp. TaxID=1871053 RepID=UPI002730583A|nr:cytochrome b/b6 domain-containing protein [Phenylobacterium sp.]MDP1872690.1 cytochrome b/b6 domain-containing protein [Phenylobacterium sp.]MDP3490792.1 cytochrome b/b6 domain-containing protein [Phenylobacterium sp.]